MDDKPHPLSLAAFADQSERQDRIIEWARRSLTHEQALLLLAKQTVELQEIEAALADAGHDRETLERVLRELGGIIDRLPESMRWAANEGRRHEAGKASLRNKKGGDAKADKPGGSREKQKVIRVLWASGKYSSRDLCAEQECAVLNMSFSAARKALRNTPDPA